MTTIAAKDGVIASDSLMNDGATSDYTRKIFRLKNGGLFGGCGEMQIVAAVAEWLNTGKGKRPEIKEADSFAGILIDKTGALFVLENRLVPVEVLSGYTATGSGGMAARAFMALGKTADEAVRLVIQHKLDINTGGDVQRLDLRRVPRKS